MMKTTVTLLSLAATVPLTIAAPDKLTCAIDGAGSLDSAVGAAVYLWASSERCAKGNPLQSDIKCAIDVTFAVKSVNDMVDTIVAAVNSCSDVNTKHAQCGLAVGGLTSAAAGLAAGSANLASWIKDKSAGGNIVVDATSTKVGKCVMDVKGVATGLFQAAAGVRAAMHGCKGTEACATNSFQVISVLSSIGGAIAHAVAHCSPKGNDNASLGGDVLGVFATLNGVAKASIAVEKQCKVPDSRLYLESAATTATTNNSISLILAAFLPMAAMLGYVGGRRSHKARRDFERVIPLGEASALCEQQD